MRELTDPPAPILKITTVEEAIARAGEIGYPIEIRPWGENSGKMRHVVNNGEELRSAFTKALSDSLYEARVDMVHLSRPTPSLSYFPTDT